jgi:hypothetical protein
VWSDAPGRAQGTAADTWEHLLARLREFLRAEPVCHVRIHHGELEDRVEPCDQHRVTVGFQPFVDGPERFVAPADWSGAPLAPEGADHDRDAAFNCVWRVGAEGLADLWVRVNHVGADGVPVQEMLSRLEKSWGTAEVFYPAPDEGSFWCRELHGTGIAQSQGFIDFAPLLAWRKSQNARLPESMTLSAALLWWLARHPNFEGRHAGTTVEVEAAGSLARGVGVVVVRPADYFGRRDGLSRYVADFNRGVALTRARRSKACAILDAAARLPPGLARALLRHGLENDPRAFGTLALTVLKDARVFGAPLAEFGHPDGFIAVGSVGLPTRDGRTVGCVTVKGPQAVVAGYPAIIAETVRACAPV